jgi:hypothetical protein
MWMPVVFAYLLAMFVTFVVKQEYQHFLEVRQDFLTRGSAHVHPQHEYSLMIENIPFELRSDHALKDYFDTLFPGKVHSASVIMKLPDLEEAAHKCTRTCRRLEKSIAYLHANETQPTHVVGRGRITLLGVDLLPLDWRFSCTGNEDILYVEDGRYSEKPARGTRVDSISYYTAELGANSRSLFKMQQQKAQIAESGNMSLRAENWYESVSRDFTEVANQILGDSVEANDLTSPGEARLTPEMLSNSVPQAEKMTSIYGTLGLSTSANCKRTRLVDNDHLVRHG